MVRILGKLLILFLLVYAGVSIWYGRLGEKFQQAAVPARKAVLPPPVEKTETLRKQDDYTIIVQRNIFKAVLVKTEQPEVTDEPEAIGPPSLKLSLMGTIFGRERDARAIISDDIKRQQDIYQVGDSIQGGIIKSIERGKVVLVVNGRNEMLSLKDREGGGPAYQPSPTDFYQEPPEQVEQPQEQPQEPGVEQPSENPQEQVQEQVQESPLGESGEQIQATPPAMTNGRQQPRVRPRPVRRPPRQVRSSGGEQQ